MSFWNRPTEAAKKAVVAPMKVTNSSAVGDSWNMGEQRQTRNTPAVTMVAGWIGAETGVGPSMASGSQVCRPSWADLPMAPTNSSRQQMVMAFQSRPKVQHGVRLAGGAGEDRIELGGAEQHE